MPSSSPSSPRHASSSSSSESLWGDVGVFLVMHVFSAFLPPPPAEQIEYYEILGLDPKTATIEDIRKAYKTKSLAMHPDKQARRSAEEREAAAREYPRVQQAHAVLSDASSRRLYHQVQCQPHLYEFLSTPQNALHPSVLVENIAQASCLDKTRLLMVVLILVVLLFLLQPILIAVKVNHDDSGALESTPWMVILIPLWFFQGLFVAMLLASTMRLLATVTSKSRWWIIWMALEHLCWLVGEIILALRWDGVFDDDVDFAVLMVPIYVALGFKWLHAIATLSELRYTAHHRMVTRHYLEYVLLDEFKKEHADTADQVEDDEDIMEVLRQEYMVVTVPVEREMQIQMVLETTTTESDEERQEIQEALMVQASVEYDHVMQTHTHIMQGLLHSVVFHSTFVALLVVKLDVQTDISWWIVFLPFWVSLGMRALWNMGMCCCGKPTIVVMQQEDEEDNNEEQKDKEEKDKYDGKKEMQDGDKKKEDTTKNGDMGHRDSPRKGDEDDKENHGAAHLNKETHDSNKDHQPASTVATTTTEVEVEVMEEGTRMDAKPDKKEDSESSLPNFDEYDEEAYRQWKSAQAEAESHASESRMKAAGSCCLILFQVMMLSLIVAKLDKEEPLDNEDADSFSAIWILFPIFVLFGLLLCCCACFIYGARKEAASSEDVGEMHDEPAEESKSHKQDSVSKQPSLELRLEDSEEQIADPSSMHEDEEAEEVQDEKQSHQLETQESDMNDLD